MRGSRSIEVGFPEDASELTSDQRLMGEKEPTWEDTEKSILSSGDLSAKSWSRNKLGALKTRKEFPHGCGQ